VDRAYAEPQLAVPRAGTNRLTGAAPMVLGHLSAAPVGIGVTGLSKIDGSGIGFVDVEGGWDLGHRDLPRVSPRHPPLRQLLYGKNLTVPVWRDHGTAVLGVVLSKGTTSRIRGIAPGARFVGVASHYTARKPFDVLGAIVAATRALDPGDVILIEAQIQGSGMPVEIMPHCMDAIRFAAACRLVVVEAAGYGAMDLDEAKGDWEAPRLRDKWSESAAPALCATGLSTIPVGGRRGRLLVGPRPVRAAGAAGSL
jgi:hypothetical protein